MFERGRGRLIQMRGSKVQLLVKNGSQTSLDSKAFILLHVTYAAQMFCKKSYSALSSSTKLLGFKEGGGALISNIAHKGVA